MHLAAGDGRGSPRGRPHSCAAGDDPILCLPSFSCVFLGEKVKLWQLRFIVKNERDRVFHHCYEFETVHRCQHQLCWISENLRIPRALGHALNKQSLFSTSQPTNERSQEHQKTGRKEKREKNRRKEKKKERKKERRNIYIRGTIKERKEKPLHSCT
jgi:hypothetical protein